jgi:hypothetical protein
MFLSMRIGFYSSLILDGTLVRGPDGEDGIPLAERLRNASRCLLDGANNGLGI